MFLVLCLALLGWAASYECISGSGEEEHEESRSGNAWIILDCGRHDISRVRGHPRRPSVKHGSIVEQSVSHFNVRMKPYIYVEYECSNTHGKSVRKDALSYDGDLLDSISGTCTTNQKIDFNLADRTYREEDLERCVGQRSCDVSVHMTYTVEYGCRSKRNSASCCDSESSRDSEHYISKVKKACGITLTCECCDRGDDEFVNIKACGTDKTVGISFNGEAYDESDDNDATDDRPDTDEEGCHVRRATMTDSAGAEQTICIPGNMAKTLRVLDKFVTNSISSDSNCKVRRTTSGCTDNLNKGVAYRFGVTVRTPNIQKSETWIRRHLAEEFEERSLNTNFRIMVDTNLHKNEGFVIWFNL